MVRKARKMWYRFKVALFRERCFKWKEKQRSCDFNDLQANLSNEEKKEIVLCSTDLLEMSYKKGRFKRQICIRIFFREEFRGEIPSSEIIFKLNTHSGAPSWEIISPFRISQGFAGFSSRKSAIGLVVSYVIKQTLNLPDSQCGNLARKTKFHFLCSRGGFTCSRVCLTRYWNIWKLWNWRKKLPYAPLWAYTSFPVCSNLCNSSDWKIK